MNDFVIPIRNGGAAEQFIALAKENNWDKQTMFLWLCAYVDEYCDKESLSDFVDSLKMQPT